MNQPDCGCVFGPYGEDPVRWNPGCTKHTKGPGDLGPPRAGGGGAGPAAPSSDMQRRACERALPALVVAEAAFKAAWGPTLVALNSTPHSADADAAVVLMFEVERALKRIAETLRGKQ